MTRTAPAGYTHRLSSPPVIFLSFVVWALVLTYPLLWQPFQAIPQGSEEVATVPLFNLWTLQWNIDQLLQGYPHYWDAPIFAPNAGAFAFSEPQPLSALLAAPLWLAFQSPALGYNAVIILFLTLNGWFTYWLVNTWTGAKLPAFLAGLMLAALPFVAQEMGVLQLSALFGFLWSLLFLSRFLASSGRQQIDWPANLGLGLGLPVTFLTCGYYGLFSMLFLPVFLLSQLRPEHLNRRVGSQLVGIGLVAFILSGSFVWVQQQHLSRYGFTRRPEVIENNSARLNYYTNFLDYNVVHGQLLNREPGPGQHLFPGFGLILLAALGPWGLSHGRIKLYLLVAIALALLLSLGLRLHLGQVQPYEWVRAYIPGFAQLRSPFRFAAWVQLHLVLLAALGIQNLRGWFLGEPGKWLATGVAALALIEALALPLPLQGVPEGQMVPAWQSWLNQLEAPPQIVLLPFAPTNQVANFEQTVHWMLENRSLRGRMVNGYSGFFPPDHARLREEMLKFPTPGGVALLREEQVDYVVVDHSLAGAPQRLAMEAHLPLAYWDEAKEVAVYELLK